MARTAYTMPLAYDKMLLNYDRVTFPAARIGRLRKDRDDSAQQHTMQRDSGGNRLCPVKTAIREVYYAQAHF